MQGYDTSDIFVTGHSLGGWEAEYVSQQTGLNGIGFESPGLNTTVPGNGVDSGFVNVETYGDPAAFLATDLPGLQPFMPGYVPGGGSKPHYGSIVMVGDPTAMNPLINSSALWGTGLIGTAIFLVDFLGNFFGHHLPGIQAIPPRRHPGSRRGAVAGIRHGSGQRRLWGSDDFATLVRGFAGGNPNHAVVRLHPHIDPCSAATVSRSAIAATARRSPSSEMASVCMPPSPAVVRGDTKAYVTACRYRVHSSSRSNMGPP